MSIGVLLLGALLALLLEATGTAPGGRKRVGRLPQVVVVVVAAIVAVAVERGPMGLAVAVALSVFALSEGPGLLGERAALGLVLGAGTWKVGSTTSPSALIAWIALWAVVTAALSVRASKDAEAEAAAKAGLLGLMAVLLAGLGVVIGAGGGASTGASAVGEACLLGAIALVLGLIGWFVGRRPK